MCTERCLNAFCLSEREGVRGRNVGCGLVTKKEESRGERMRKNKKTGWEIIEAKSYERSKAKNNSTKI